MLEQNLTLILAASAFLLALSTLILGRLHVKRLNLEEFNDLIQPILANVNRRIAGLEEKVGEIGFRVEKSLIEAAEFKGKSSEYEKSIHKLNESIKDVLRAQVNIVRALTAVEEKVQGLSRRIRRTSLPVKDKKTFGSPTSPSTGNGFFRIKSEDVKLARLTPTEMTVLRVLATSGPKTASEIREVIGKTREHSSRLMKKLFLQGYVERDTTTIPYTYRISEKIKESFEFSAGGERGETP